MASPSEKPSNKKTPTIKQPVTTVQQQQPTIQQSAPSAYQANLASLYKNAEQIITPPPTSREVYGRIAKVNEFSPSLANKLYTGFEQAQNTQGSPYYAPYKQPTNKAITDMSDLGYDTSVIDDNFYAKNNDLLQYRKYNGTTNTPSSPGTKASNEEKASYALWQIEKADATTKSAIQEWDALQDELTYLAKSPKNYSPDQIVNMVYSNGFASKYPTLAAMDKSLEKGQALLELNQGIDYSKDNCYTVIWRAQNEDLATGVMDADSAMSVNGAGKQWEDNPEISAKLDAGNKETYSPHSVGMTMDDEGMYFNMDGFDQQWVDDNAYRLNSLDPVEKKNYISVMEGEERTQAAEAELEALNKKVDGWISRGVSYDRAMKLLDIELESGDYKTLVSMDKGMAKGTPVELTRAVDYRKADIETRLREGCAKEKEKTDTTDVLVNGVAPALFGFVFGQQEQEPEQPKQKPQQDRVKAPQPKPENNQERVSNALDNKLASSAFSRQAISEIEAQTARMKDSTENEIRASLESEMTPSESAGTSGWSVNSGNAIDSIKLFKNTVVDRFRDGSKDEFSALVGNGTKRVMGSYITGTMSLWTTINDYNTADANLLSLRAQEQQLSEELGFLQYSDVTWNGEVYPYIQDANQQITFGDHRYQLVMEDNGNGGLSVGDVLVWRDDMQAFASVSDPDEYNTVSHSRQAKEAIESAMEQKKDIENAKSFDGMIDEATAEKVMNLRQIRVQIQDAEAYIDGHRESYDAAMKQYEANARMVDVQAKLLVGLGLDPTELLTAGTVMQGLGQFAYYEPTVWDTVTASNIFADELYSVTSGKTTDKSAEDVFKDAQSIRENVSEEIKDLEWLNQYLDSNGIALDPSVRDNINRKKASLERDLYDIDSFMLMQDKDFAAKADAGRHIEYDMGYQYFSDDYDSYFWGLENASEDKFFDREGIPITEKFNPNSLFARCGGITNYRLMTQDEKDTYYYYLSESDEKAAEYISSLTDPVYGVLTTRADEQLREEWARMTEEDFLGTNVTSVLLAPMTTLMGGGYLAYSMISGDEFNPHSRWMAASNAKATVREQSAKEINETFGEGTIVADAAKLFYDIAIMRAESATFGNLTGFLGSEAEYANFWTKALAEIGSASPMGVSAAVDAVGNAKSKGASDTQAYAIGGFTFAAETITEGISLDNMREARLLGKDFTVDGAKEFMINWLTRAGVSEALGESFNDMVEKAVDEYYMGDKSEHADRVFHYRMMNYDKDTAEYLARQDEFGEIMYTALVAYLSPGLDVYQTVQGRRDAYRDVQADMNQFGGNYTLRDARNQVIANEMAERKANEEAEERWRNGEDFVPLNIPENNKAGKASNIAESQGNVLTEGIAVDFEILVTAQDGNLAVHDASVAAVLDEEGTQESKDISQAAANALHKVVGEETTPAQELHDVMAGAVVANINPSIVKQGFQVAALSGDKSAVYQIMQSDNYKQATPDVKAAAINQALKKDLSNPEVQQAAQQTVHDFRIAAAEAALMSESMGEEAQKADEEIYINQEVLATQIEKEEAAKTARDNAINAFADNPSEDNYKVLKEKNANYAARVAERQQAQETLDRSREEAKQVKQKAIKDIRAQAEAAVVQQEQQIAEVKAQQEEQERIVAEQEAQMRAEQQENDNFARAKADEIIGQYYENATDEEKEKIRKLVRKNNMTETSKVLERRDYVNRIAKKFGYTIEIGDTTQGGRFLYQNASVDPNTGHIILSQNATVQDAMYGFLIHEITHIAESSGLYDELANSLLKLKYGDNTAQIDADVNALQDLYANGLTRLQQQGANVNPNDATPEYARQELVANLMGELMQGDPELLERFAKESPNVARRIIDSIKSFLKKMVGIQDAPLTEAQRIVDTLEAALKDANATQQGNRKYRIPKSWTGENGYLLTGDEWWRVQERISQASRGEGEGFINHSDGRSLIAIGNTMVYTTNGNIDHVLDIYGNDIWSQNDIQEYIMEAERSNYSYEDQLGILQSVFGEESTFFRDRESVLRDQGQEPRRTGYDQIGMGEEDRSDISLQGWEKSRTEFDELTENVPNKGYWDDLNNSPFYEEYLRENGMTKFSLPEITDENGDPLATELPGGTIALDMDRKYSLSSFNSEEQDKVRDALMNSGRFTTEQIDKYLADALGIASVIASDRARLDYEADPEKTMLKPNAEYVKTLDASTLCAKRLLYQGTFDAIQHLLPNTPLLPEDLIDLSNLMREMGYETPCGICYVESRRRQLGKFTEQWLESYNGEYKPSIDEVTTSDGLERLRTEHPQAYEDFITAMNKKGTMNPKVVQLRTDYRGEIRDMTPGQIQKVKDIGGLRVQSFSDFETPHLLDMVQAVLDMSAKGLTAQAYTKVPNFPWAFGDTGIKINLSLIGKGTGLNENGELVFDDVEGMPFDEAMKLRERYSKNVGTILVGINDAHILAAMADPRIDFIIPFHKSGWSSSELEKMPVLNSYSDYTNSQNEKAIVGKDKKGNYRTEPLANSKRVNFQPVGENGYWDFTKTGKENAENYLRMCAEDGRLPKFSQFLVDNGDGSFSLQPDGSTDGYWKTLIDFKMYDNDGNGAPQQEVTPDINMPEAMRVLQDYSLDRNGITRKSNNDLPVATPVVERYVEEFKEKNPRMRYSLPSDAPYLSAVERGEMDEAQRMVDEAAKEAGYTIRGYHGTNASFTVFDPGKLGSKNFMAPSAALGFFAAKSKETAEAYTGLNALDMASLALNTETSQQMERIKQEHDFDNVTRENEEEKERFEEEYKRTHEYNEMVEDRLAFANSVFADSMSDDAREEFLKQIRVNFEYEWNTKYLNDMMSAWSETDEAKAYEKFTEDIYKEWEDYEIKRRGYTPNVKSLYLKMDNPFVYDFKGEGRDTESFAARMAAAKEAGYDGCIFLNVADGADIDDIYTVFSNTQLKSADAVTYDDNGNVIPLSERFNTENEDIRYSLPSDDILERQIRGYLEGMNPLATSATPGPQRQFGSQTAQSSDELSEATKNYLKQNSGYIPDTNEAQINRAIDWIRSNKSNPSSDGLYESVQKIINDGFDYRSADGQARMIATMGMAVSKGDTLAQITLADAFNRQGTDLGRALQTRKLFRLMTPAGRVSMLQNMLQKYQEELDAKGIKKELRFSDFIYQAASVATEEGDFDLVRAAAAQELAEQIPANWRDRIRSLRMLSMLANPRTHIRNIIGNAMFIPAVGMKNKVAALMELGRKQGNRTKTLSPFLSAEARRFARMDAQTMKDTLRGEAKYNEDSAVKQMQKPFRGLLQAIIDLNSNALEAEDWIFLKGHYRRALGGWMMANGYTAEQLQNNPSLLEEGRAYAVQEAQKATYRDFNQLAQTLNNVSRNGGVAGFLVDAILPFKKTPANILRRGIEYSPVSLMRSLTTDLYHLKQWYDAQNGKLNAMPERALSPTQWIDRLCSGLSGTMIMVLGGILSSAGIISVGYDDDDEFEKAKGGQQYALRFNIGGQDFTFTMDWAAPMSMPFFVGAAVQEQLANQDGFSIEALVDAFGNIMEPVFNLSMLDGVNTLFKTSQYDDTNTLTQIGAKIATNYLTSYVPSIGGAVARTIDDTRRKAFVRSGEGTGVLGTARYALEQTENKIPGLSQTNIPVRDIWGNPETSSLTERLLENFVLPGYVAEYRDDPILNEMERVYQITGDKGLVPSEPPKSFTYNKQKYVLDAEQWDTYKQVRGQTAYEVLSALIQSDAYKNADTSTQNQMLSDAWSYADKVGRAAIVPDYELPKMGDSPVNTIAKDATITSNKNEMIKALNAGDYDAYDTMVQALRDEGVEDSEIKRKISDTYRDQFKTAYRNDDEETMAEIEDILDNTGFDFKIYDKGGWADQVDDEMDKD